MLQRPRSQDISGIPLENNSSHDSVENESRFFSPKQKLNLVKKGNLVWEENRHLGKFFERRGDMTARSNNATKHLYKTKVFKFHSYLCDKTFLT